MNFLEKLLKASHRNESLLCVGLDPDPALMPPVELLSFNKAIIDATADLVCAYKPNLAFYEALGLEGMRALQETVKYIPTAIPSIGDAKRGDVGHTARAYARALFDTLGFDAATVNPYLGYDSLEPFLSYRDKGVFILCKPSNPGSADFQDALCPHHPLFEVVAERAQSWNSQGNVGLVVGATYPQQLRRVREICPHLPLLVPGIGAQGGDLAQSLRSGVDEKGERLIIVSSRQVLYASQGKDFALAARRQALLLRDQIRQLRAELGFASWG